MEDKGNCYIYCRVSTDEQAKEGYSLEAQQKICTEKAKELEYRVAGVFVDEGQSATVSNRPEFLKMLNEVESKPTTSIIVYNTDRFARNAADHFMIKERLKKVGAKLISVAQPMLDESPEGKLLDTFMAGINQFYSEDLSRKTKRGMGGRWEQGWWLGPAPLGYINLDKDGKISGKAYTPEKQHYFDELKLKRPLGLIEQDPDVAPLIKLIFKLYATQRYSFKKLGRILYKKGFRTRNGEPLAHSTLYQIITNTFYYGLMKQKKSGLEKMGRHEPIIDKTIFDVCKLIAEKKGNYATRERDYWFMLRGLLVCSECAEQWTAQWRFNLNSKKNDKIAYYRCQKRLPCKQAYIEVGEMEKMAYEQLKRIKFTKGFTDALTRKVKRYLKSHDGNEAKERRKLLNIRSGYIQKRKVMEERLYDKTIDRATFKRGHDDIQTKINSVDDKLVELESTRQFDFDLLEEVLAMTRNIPKTYKEAPDFLKKRYLQFFFDDIVIKDKKIEITHFSPLIQELINQQQVILSSPWLPLVDLFLKREIEFDIQLPQVQTLYESFGLPLYATN